MSARRPWVVIGVWVLVVAVALGLVRALLPSATTTELSLGSNYESEQAAALLEERLRGPTPLNELVLVSQVRDIRKPGRFVVGLGFLPLRLRTLLMNRIMSRAQKRDVDQDVIIWERKKYLPRPRLSRADGEIAVYRRYCQQFYGDARDQVGRDLRHLRSV